MTSADKLSAIVKPVLEEVAPDEVPLMGLFVSRFRETRGEVAPTLSGEDREAGIGLPSGELVITYIVLQVLAPIAESVVEGIATGAKALTSEVVKGLLRPKASEASKRFEELMKSIDTSLISAKDLGKVAAFRRYLDSLVASPTPSE